MPAFPTDGGRVFRSYLERKHDEYTATMLTVTASKYMLAVFVLGSVAYLFLIGASLFNMEFMLLWDLLIVFYLYGGAMSERQTAELKREAKGLSVRGAVTRHFALVKPEASVRDLYALVTKSGEHLFITKLEGGYAYVNLLGTRRRGNPRTARDLADGMPSMPCGHGAGRRAAEDGRRGVGHGRGHGQGQARGDSDPGEPADVPLAARAEQERAADQPARASIRPGLKFRAFSEGLNILLL